MGHTNPKLVVSVVDDDYSVRKSLKRLLKSIGIEAVTFASADDFLEYADQDEIGYLILDVQMPGFSGLDLQKRLIDSGSSLPIIFISAKDNGDHQEQAMEAGALAYLKKPFEDQELIDAIFSAAALGNGESTVNKFNDREGRRKRSC